MIFASIFCLKKNSLQHQVELLLQEVGYVLLRPILLGLSTWARCDLGQIFVFFSDFGHSGVVVVVVLLCVVCWCVVAPNPEP